MSGELQDPRPNVDGSVNYSVKELIARVELKIDGLYDHLDAKANQSDFLVVKNDVEGLKEFKFRVYGALTVITVLLGAGAIQLFT